MTKNCKSFLTSIAGAMLMTFAIGCTPPEKDVDVSTDTDVAETNLGSGTSSNLTESVETPDGNTTTGTETPTGETPETTEESADGEKKAE